MWRERETERNGNIMWQPHRQPVPDGREEKKKKKEDGHRAKIRCKSDVTRAQIIASPWSCSTSVDKCLTENAETVVFQAPNQSPQCHFSSSETQRLDDRNYPVESDRDGSTRALGAAIGAARDQHRRRSAPATTNWPTDFIGIKWWKSRKTDENRREPAENRPRTDEVCRPV